MLVFPVLHTSRLKLRQLSVDDFQDLVLLANNKNISDQIINIPYPYQEGNAVFRMSYIVQGFKSKQRFVFAIIEKKRNKFIGEISIHIQSNVELGELGYWIGEPFWNQGYATEAINEIVKFGFTRICLENIYGTVTNKNTTSSKVLLKNGFKLKSSFGNTEMYEISKNEWNE